MVLILYAWEAYNEKVLKSALEKEGNSVTVFSKKCTHYSRDIEFAGELINLIHLHSAQAVISFNYIPIISMACNVAGVIYYSWIYDNPHLPLYAKTVDLSCNRIGIFDKSMVEDMKRRGATTTFHLPLAVDIEQFDQTIANCDTPERFDCDVSFVGTLYTDEYNYYDRIYPNGKFPQIDSIINECAFEPEIEDKKEELRVRPDGISYAISVMKENGLSLGEDYYEAMDEIAMASVFERKITIIERDILMHRLAKMKDVRFNLYTGSKTDIQTKGIVKYDTEMPIAFNRSKININLSLRSIHTGISLRILDIMACGGFLLSSRQPELLEFFEDGKEVALFTTPEECEDKIRYYLAHDAERRAIAKAGKERVKELFSYDKLLPRLINSK